MDAESYPPERVLAKAEPLNTERAKMRDSLARQGPLEGQRSLQGEGAEHAQVRLRGVLPPGEEDPERMIGGAAQRGSHHVGQAQQLDQSGVVVHVSESPGVVCRQIGSHYIHWGILMLLLS